MIIIIHFFRNWFLIRSINTEKFAFARPNIGLASPLVVYSIPCSDCEKVCLGQTKRQFCARLKKHQRAVSNSNGSKSALTEHACETSHDIALDDSRIITTNNRYGQRLCLQACMAF